MIEKWRQVTEKIEVKTKQGCVRHTKVITAFAIFTYFASQSSNWGDFDFVVFSTIFFLDQIQDFGCCHLAFPGGNNLLKQFSTSMVSFWSQLSNQTLLKEFRGVDLAQFLLPAIFGRLRSCLIWYLFIWSFWNWLRFLKNKFSVPEFGVFVCLLDYDIPFTVSFSPKVWSLVAKSIFVPFNLRPDARRQPSTRHIGVSIAQPNNFL